MHCKLPSKWKDLHPTLSQRELDFVLLLSAAAPTLACMGHKPFAADPGMVQVGAVQIIGARKGVVESISTG